MGLPNIGPLELIVVLAVALLVIGPRRLPEMGATVGKTIREFRSSMSGISDPLGLEASPNDGAEASPADAAAAPVPQSPAPAPQSPASATTPASGDGSETVKPS